MEFDDARKIEFDALAKFFADFKYAKRRYPMIITYNKHLEKISSDADKDKEVDNFKRFLVANQSLAEKKLTSPDFKTGKPTLTLAMDNFSNFSGPDSPEAESFWKNILKIEKVMFPEGKPAQMETASGRFPSAMAAFEHNPIMTDVIAQVKNMGNLDDITDVSSFMSKPEFQQMVNNLKMNIQTGKYSIKDLTGTVTDVIKGVQNDLDEETKNTLKAVTDTMGAVERNEQVDMNNLMNMVSDLKVKNLGGA